VTRSEEHVKCPRCGEEVKCDLHGDGWVKMDFSFGLKSLPFFWCDKCFEEYMSVFGSVIHDHFTDFINGVSKDEEHSRSCAEEYIRRVRPKSIVYLFSGGRDSSLALLLTRDLVKKLSEELKSKVYLLYVCIPGNTHPLNTFVASVVMKWHEENYGFKPVFATAEKVFQEYVIKYGLQMGKGRWCYVEFKEKVFRECEKRLPRPLLEVDGMSPRDSKIREKIIDAEFQLVSRKDGTWFYAWHPLFSLTLSDEEKLKILESHEEFKPVVVLYKVFGDSLNCVVCPYKSHLKLMKHHAVEDLTVLYYFARQCLKSERWRRYFSRLLSVPLVYFLRA